MMLNGAGLTFFKLPSGREPSLRTRPPAPVYGHSHHRKPLILQAGTEFANMIVEIIF
jgi:hypothetical protein